MDGRGLKKRGLWTGATFVRYSVCNRSASDATLARRAGSRVAILPFVESTSRTSRTMGADRADRGFAPVTPIPHNPRKTEKSGRSRIERTLSRGQVAEQVGFEPTVDFRLLRFSRPTPSATRPLLPCGARSCCARPIYHEKLMMQDHGYGGELYRA